MNKHFRRLQEADYVPVSLNDKDMMDPSSLSLKDVAKRNKDAADRAEAEQAKKERSAANKAKYGQIEEIIKSGLEADKRPSDILDDIFSIVVPSSGKADTKAGEIIRAMMRVIYRCYNDGDKFFEGYGLETAAPSVAYLMDTIPAVDDYVRDMFEDLRIDTDIAYEKALEEVTKICLEYILANTDTIFEDNEEDSRDWSGSTLKEIEENQPRYEYDIWGSDDIVTLVENGVLDAWDLKEYVEDMMQWQDEFEGAEIDRPWSRNSTELNITNLKKDGYVTIDYWFNNKEDQFWGELVEQHKDELDAIYNGDDEDEDDDIDESVKAKKLTEKSRNPQIRKIEIDLAKELGKNNLKLNPEEMDLETAAEYIYMSGANTEYTVQDWIKDTKENYPECFLNESVKEAYKSDYELARPNMTAILNALDNDLVNPTTLILQLLKWVPDDDLKGFVEFYDYGSLNENTINVNLVPDNIAPDHLIGDIHLDASGQSVGIAGGTGGTVSNTGHTSNSTNNTKRVLEPAKN